MCEKVTSVDCFTDDRLMEDCDLAMVIRCKSAEDMAEIGDYIHNQLIGNQDYIDNNIVLNYEKEILTTKKDGKDIPVTNYRVIIAYFNNATTPVGFTIDPNILRKKEG